VRSQTEQVNEVLLHCGVVSKSAIPAQARHGSKWSNQTR